jgi:hypothetical protein
VQRRPKFTKSGKRLRREKRNVGCRNLEKIETATDGTIVIGPKCRAVVTNITAATAARNGVDRFRMQAKKISPMK